MIEHRPMTVLILTEAADLCFCSFLSYLNTLPHVRSTCRSKLPVDLNEFNVIVSRKTPPETEVIDNLQNFVQAGGGWLEMVDGSETPIPSLFGVQALPVGPPSEMRVMFKDQNHPLSARIPDAVYLQGSYHALKKISKDTETLLYIDWRYQHSPVMTLRSFGEGQVACTTLKAYDDPTFQKICYRLIRFLAGQPLENRTLQVGLLGYASSVGKYHGNGVEATDGLSLKAVCDVNPFQLSRALQEFSGLQTYNSAEALAKDPNVDVVIITTPPDSHARLALQMMTEGKHVVCEKPLALNRRETVALVETAEDRKVHLSCHQNRRFDADYLAIKQAVMDGLLGDLFYMETFVGGFKHPCGFWHSHAPISGGAAYDWGGHYIDWIVSLIPERVTAVIGTRQKRVWHDVTNADQESVQIRFENGKEAYFIHSDIAAVRKPKWYLLGTEGAIVGNWKDVTTYQIDSLHYFDRYDIPSTEMTPDLTLYRRHRSGQIVPQKLAVPERKHYQFHRNLADHLLNGEPIEAPLEQSVKVVSILEAAVRSAEKGGSVEAARD